MISWAIEALIASTILMLVVLVLRAPVRREFGANIAYLLWVLPVARLLLPPMPGQWQWSRLFAPMVDRLETTQMVGGVLNGARATPEIVRHAAMRAEIMTTTGLTDIVIVPPTIVDQGAPIAAVLLGFWAIGALSFIGWHLIRYHIFVRSVVRQADATMLDGVRMIETDAATGPLAFGIWRKYVAFPRDFRERYDREEQALALAHELTHHARGDLIANWVALVVLALHWFNPLAWSAFRAFRADQEMACDARVLAGRSAALTHAYGRAIVKSAHGRAVSAACHLHTINDLKGRLRMLSTTKKSRLRVAGGALSVCALTLGGLGLTASGTQAAERLRSKVGSTIGVELAKLDRLAADATAPLAPLPPLRPAAAQAPAALQAVPMPPSAAADPAPPAPPAPPIVVMGGTGDKGETGGKQIIMIRRHGDAGKGHDAGKGDGNTVEKTVRIVVRRKDGAVITEEFKGMPDMPDVPDVPEVMSLRCKEGRSGTDKDLVMSEVKDGKHRIVICTDRVKRLASNSSFNMVDSVEIERKAYRSALDGLRSARNRMSAKGGPGQSEAVKALDQAIAEVEADLAKVK